MALHHSFSGKRVLITGGGRGIGRQFVQRFHDDGAIVFTIDKNPDSVQKLKLALPKVTAEVVDLVDWDATRKVVESFGVMDHLVNNAGILIPQAFMDITMEATTAQFDVNLAAIVNVSQVVAKRWIKEGRGGSIVNIASMTARQGGYMFEGAIYAATKAGVENLTKSMALELGQHNIRVNAVSPGAIDTPLLSTSREGIDMAKAVERWTQRLVIKRMIEPNEIADLVMFLLSPLSAMMVGECVVIDAGFQTT